MKDLKHREEPACSIVRKLGGVCTTAKILNISPPAVSRWAKPAIDGGLGGLIPQQRWAEILAFAHHHGIKITVEDLMGKAP